MTGKMSPQEALVLLKTAFVAARTSSPVLRPAAIQTVVECAKDVGRAMRAFGIPPEQAVIEVKHAAHAAENTENDITILDRAVAGVIQGVYEPDIK